MNLHIKIFGHGVTVQFLKILIRGQQFHVNLM